MHRLTTGSLERLASSQLVALMGETDFARSQAAAELLFKRGTAALDALVDVGRPRRVELCVLIDRGHRELPIHADHVGRTVQTSDREVIEVRLREVDGEERVMLCERVG